MNLTMKRVFKAPCQIVFKSWIEPEAIKKWFAPSAEWAVSSASMDVRVGGKYRFEARSTDNKTWFVYGEYKEIVPNKKIVFTWSTEDVKDTLVTVNFEDLGGSTELNLIHDLLPQEQMDMHTYGWNGCLENLSTKMFN